MDLVWIIINQSRSKLIKAELLSDVVIFSLLSSDNSVSFCDKTLDLFEKNLKYLIFDENIK